MQIKNIEKVLKRTRTVQIMPDPAGGVLWLSDGDVYMPLFGFPALTKENVQSLLNIKEDDLDKWSINIWTLPEEMCFSEYPEVGDKEELLERSRIVFQYGGFTVEPLATSKGLIFLNRDDIAPFEKEDRNIQLFARFTEDGSPYVAVKAGMFLKGIIMNNTHVVTEELQRLLEYTATGIKNIFKN